MPFNPVLFFELGRDENPQADAIYNFHSDDVGLTNSTWKNRNLNTIVSKNIIYNSSGLLPSEGSFSGTVTQNAANGPTYANTAAKIRVLNTVGGETSSAFYKPFFNKTLPLGTYIFRFKIKSAIAGVVQKVRYAINSTSATTNIDLNDDWQTIEISHTVTSVVANNYFVIGSQIGMGAQEFFIDELQYYQSTEIIPDFVNEGNDGNLVKQFGLRNPITKNGNFVTNSPLALLSPQFPIEKEWSEMTALFAIRVTSDTSQVLLSTIAHAFLGTTLGTLSYSITNGEPIFSLAVINKTGKLTNQGFFILGFSFSATHSNSYVNEVLLRENNTNTPPIKAQIISMMNRLQNINTFTGDVAIINIWDKKMNESQWQRAVRNSRKKLSQLGAEVRNRNWYFAEGDSITASSSLPQGESFAYRMATELFNDNTYLGHLNFATAGHSLSFVEGDLPYALNRIAEAKKGGGKVIFSLLIGRNDNSTLTSSAAVAAYWLRLKNYLSAIRDAGGLTIMCTCLPSGTAATNGGPSGSWEIYRNELNALMRAEPSAYDALADFGNPAVTIMGDVSTADNTTYYAPDGVHPYPAGHANLAAIIKPIIQSLL